VDAGGKPLPLTVEQNLRPLDTCCVCPSQEAHTAAAWHILACGFPSGPTSNSVVERASGTDPVFATALTARAFSPVHMCRINDVACRLMLEARWSCSEVETLSDNMTWDLSYSTDLSGVPTTLFDQEGAIATISFLRRQATRERCRAAQFISRRSRAYPCDAPQINPTERVELNSIE
jgi:hypothetical protein